MFTPIDLEHVCKLRIGESGIFAISDLVHIAIPEGDVDLEDAFAKQGVFRPMIAIVFDIHIPIPIKTLGVILTDSCLNCEGNDGTEKYQQGLHMPVILEI